MGVYIKGMEMPTDGCKGCIFVNRKWLGDICPFLKRDVSGNVERGGFQTDCPLIPVPPHGRLIDAGELERKIGENIDKAKSMGQGAYGWWYACNVAEDFVLSAPTIIPAEEGE